MPDTSRIRTSDHRKHIPLSVKLQACLLLLGFTEDDVREGQIEWDHEPCLALRVVDEETGKLRPLPNDPRYIRPLRKADHKVKTNGPGGERRICAAGGDQHAIARTVRLARDHSAFTTRRDVAAPAETVSIKPKRAGRPMAGGRASPFKKRFDGRVVARERKSKDTPS